MAKLGSVGYVAPAGLPAGGLAGQTLAKATAADQDTAWQSRQYPMAPVNSPGRWVLNQLTGGVSLTATAAQAKLVFMPIWLPTPATITGLAVYSALTTAPNAYYLGGAGATGTGAAMQPGALPGYSQAPYVQTPAITSTPVQMAIADLTASPINFPAGWSYISVGCASSFTPYGHGLNSYHIPPGFNSTTETLTGPNYLTYSSSTAGFYWYDPAIALTRGASNTSGITLWWRYA